MSRSVRLKVPLPAQLVDEFLKRMPYLSESLLAWQLDMATRAEVRYELRPGDEAQAGVVAERIAALGAELARARRPAELKLLVARRRPTAFARDPHPMLEAMDELHRYGSGRFGFGPRLLELMDLFDRDVRALADRMPPCRISFPR